MKQETIALLEFDKNRISKVMPEHFDTTPKNLPERCVIAFSHTSVLEVAEKYNAKLTSKVVCCTCEIPIYLLDFQGTQIALTVGFIGASNAAMQVEELYAAGVRKFVVCGSCGALTSNPLGALVIPDSAVRDEGASFHYAPPSYEIKADREVIESIAGTLKELSIPHTFGKTWTTDAMYRETEEKIALRRSQGCVTVEMEASAMMAAAQFHGARLGQILYCGDDLSSDEYDHRNFFSAAEIRRNLTEFSLQCCKDLTV